MAFQINPKLKALNLPWKDCYLSQVANDLIRKKYLPESFAHKLQYDPQIQQASIWNYAQEMVSEQFCPHCQITIKGPKEWIKQHIKTHFTSKEKRENEIQIAKTRPYF